MKADEKYVKSMKAKGFVQTKVWVPPENVRFFQFIAKYLRDTFNGVRK